MLVAESHIHLLSAQSTWSWYAYQKASGAVRCSYNGEISVLDKGLYISFGEQLTKEETSLTAYRQFSYRCENVVGAIKGDNYAFYDLEKKEMLFEGGDNDGVDELCFYSPDVHIYKEYKRLVARDNCGELLWQKTFQLRDGVGIIQESLADSTNHRVYIHYQEGPASDGTEGFRQVIILNVINGEVVAEYEVSGGIFAGGLHLENNSAYVVDDAQIWQLDEATNEVLKKVNYPAYERGSTVAFTQNTITLIHRNGQLVILNKTTLNHLHTLDLAQGQYVCSMTGNKTGIAVRLVDKNAYRFNAAGYGLYLTDAQLLAGEMPDLTPEPLAATIEQQSAEGGYNLLVTINAGLTVADFLRHTSHALWQTPYQHASVRSTINRNETHQGNPDFKGTLTLNLTHAPTLTREQDQAVTAIVNGAKNILDECVVDLGGENERPVDIVVER